MRAAIFALMISALPVAAENMTGEERIKTKACRDASFNLSEATQDLERWDADDRQWAYDRWGSKADSIMSNRRFMAQVYDAMVTDCVMGRDPNGG